MGEAEVQDPPQFVPDPPLVAQLASARDHPAMAWFEGVGGSAWPDDWPIHPRVLSHCICRFRRGDEACYVWFERPHWWVRPWRPLRRLCGSVERFESLGAALGWLVSAAPPAGRWSWWPFGGRAEPGAAPDQRG
jgi:hypothetical protein